MCDNSEYLIRFLKVRTFCPNRQKIQKLRLKTSNTESKEDEGEKNGRIKIFKDSLGVPKKERYNPSPEYLKIIEKTNKRIEEGHRQMDEAYISASSFICHSNNIEDDLQR